MKISLGNYLKNNLKTPYIFKVFFFVFYYYRYYIIMYNNYKKLNVMTPLEYFAKEQLYKSGLELITKEINMHLYEGNYRDESELPENIKKLKDERDKMLQLYSDLCDEIREKLLKNFE